MNLSPRRYWPIALFTLAVVLIAVAGFWIFQKEQPSATPPKAESPKPAEAAQATPQSTPTATPTVAATPESKEAAALERIENALKALKHGTPEQNEEVLKALSRALAEMPPAQAIAAIRKFLATGQDAPTGLEYSPGPGGVLAAAPSLRVFLLDQLGVLAKAGKDPEASLAVSREILSTPGSADEWSVALRNVAWADKNSNDYLNQKFGELLSKPEWRSNPSIGMLESFDIPVYTQDVSVIPQLDKALQEPGLPMNQAAAVALDRLAEEAPLKVMDYLNSNPTVLGDSPMLRADYFSKADLTDAAQVQAIEAYFSRKDVTPAEITKTIDGLVSPGSFVSDNLLTTSNPPEDRGAKNLDALQKLAPDWGKRFPPAGQEIGKFIQRNQPQ
jgi:hypothetical protein